MKSKLRSSAYGRFGSLSGYATQWIQQRLQDTHKLTLELRRMELKDKRNKDTPSKQTAQGKRRLRLEAGDIVTMGCPQDPGEQRRRQEGVTKLKPETTTVVVF
ncbi:hypothetical protein F2Q69_00047654 [Brassica cretica]|uniref:Uncharacterized protein n=1 Tax=Brassica cretica TaxID=69181 RepID=A0A8S9PGM3_BRACR|nr:hypothetical protein F2Q69_00047654 [Brassica cretica]